MLAIVPGMSHLRAARLNPNVEWLLLRTAAGWSGSRIVLSSAYEAHTRIGTLIVLLILERTAENYAPGAMLLSTELKQRVENVAFGCARFCGAVSTAMPKAGTDQRT
jgi:hypothetical protein